MSGYEYGKVDRFDRDARVEVIDLSTGDRHAGYVVEDRGRDAQVVVRYDDGTLVRVGHAFVRPEQDVNTR